MNNFEDSFKMTIAQNIKKYRKEKNLTQKAFAGLIGKTESSIGKYETGLTEIPISVLKQISIVLDVSIDNLLDDGTNKFINNIRQAEKEILAKDEFFHTVLADMGIIVDQNLARTIFRIKEDNIDYHIEEEVIETIKNETIDFFKFKIERYLKPMRKTAKELLRAKIEEENAKIKRKKRQLNLDDVHKDI